jgi:hypothetical protein
MVVLLLWWVWEGEGGAGRLPYACGGYRKRYNGKVLVQCAAALSVQDET